MTAQKLSKFLAGLESFLFSTETPEALVLAIRPIEPAAVEGVLSGRQLTECGEPFKGFSSPPGRF